MNPSSAIESFFTHYPQQTYHKGDVIIQAGSMPAAYYIVQGTVAQYDISEAGDKLILNMYKPGAFIPLSSILNSIPSEFFFEATSELIVYRAPAEKTAQFLKDTPEVTYDALARISRGSNGLMHRLARVMEGNAEGRIIQELEIMRARFATESNKIHITEAELAAQTGLARETVSRALKRLNEKKIIRSSRGIIEIL